MPLIEDPRPKLSRPLEDASERQENRETGEKEVTETDKKQDTDKDKEQEIGKDKEQDTDTETSNRQDKDISKLQIPSHEDRMYADKRIEKGGVHGVVFRTDTEGYWLDGGSFKHPIPQQPFGVNISQGLLLRPDMVILVRRCVCCVFCVVCVLAGWVWSVCCGVCFVLIICVCVGVCVFCVVFYSWFMRLTCGWVGV